jgi:hypothetical protein
MLRIKDKIKCPDCGVTLRSAPKMAAIFSFLILFVVFITYPVDWRLSVFSAIILGLIGISRIKYQVVDGEK